MTPNDILRYKSIGALLSHHQRSFQYQMETNIETIARHYRETERSHLHSQVKMDVSIKPFPESSGNPVEEQ